MTPPKVRTVYAGLFELRICDALMSVAVVGPRRSRSGYDKVSDNTVEQNRLWALSKARNFELLGYSIQTASAS